MAALHKASLAKRLDVEDVDCVAIPLLGGRDHREEMLPAMEEGVEQFELVYSAKGMFLPDVVFITDTPFS